MCVSFCLVYSKACLFTVECHILCNIFSFHNSNTGKINKSMFLSLLICSSLFSFSFGLHKTVIFPKDCLGSKNKSAYQHTGWPTCFLSWKIYKPIHFLVTPIFLVVWGNTCDLQPTVCNSISLMHSTLQIQKKHCMLSCVLWTQEHKCTYNHRSRKKQSWQNMHHP